MKFKVGGSQLKDNIARLHKWKDGNNPGPLVIEITATHGCNHNCLHCSYQQYSPYDRYKFFSDSTVFKQFLQDFKSLGGVEVYFGGKGEPMLNPLLSEWIQYGHGIGLNMTIGSNGILLNDRKSRAILPFVKWIKFSVNAGDRLTYTKVHRCKAGDFDKLIHNLEKTVKNRNFYNLDALIVIQFLTYDSNWTSIPSILDIHRKIGTDLLIFRNVVPKEKPLFYSKDIIDALKEIDGEERVHIRWDTYREKGGELDWKKCYGINFRTNMDQEGNLFTCFRQVFKDSIYGNIHKDRFINIWSSSRKKKVFSEVEQQAGRPDCKKWCSAAYDNAFIRNYLGEERDGK